jgi:hypothetical protein
MINYGGSRQSKNHRNYAEFRWQKRLSVLFAQPTREFHGINLQDGSNIIAFFVHWSNLEEYQQSFERIDSTRQA